VALGIEVVVTAAMLGLALAAVALDLGLALIWLSLPLASLAGLPLAYLWLRTRRGEPVSP
jgi:hypothetical protein